MRVKIISKSNVFFCALVSILMILEFYDTSTSEGGPCIRLKPDYKSLTGATCFGDNPVIYALILIIWIGVIAWFFLNAFDVRLKNKNRK